MNTYFSNKVPLDSSNEASSESHGHRLKPVRVLVQDVVVESGGDVDDGVILDDL